jgi:hypothetical protein
MLVRLLCLPCIVIPIVFCASCFFAAAIVLVFLARDTLQQRPAVSRAAWFCFDVCLYVTSAVVVLRSTRGWWTAKKRANKNVPA